MRKLAVAMVMLGLGLAQAARAEDQDDAKAPPKSHAKTTPNAHSEPRVVPHVQQPQRNVQSPYGVPRVNPAQPPIHQPNQPHMQPNLRVPNDPAAPRTYVPRVQPNRVPNDPSVPRAYVPRPVGTPPVGSNPNARNWQNRKNAENGNSQTRNWNKNNNPRQYRPANTITWEEARRRHYRQYHHHDWWRSHYTRFVLFGGGYYFWDNGYWYPAYGYDPAYNGYEYEEPIYAYGDLEPSDVIANLQTALQDLGYFPYEVDGQMGPMTRTAISNYQRDYGLEITSAIDEPTLESLGLMGD